MPAESPWSLGLRMSSCLTVRVDWTMRPWIKPKPQQPQNTALYTSPFSLFSSFFLFSFFFFLFFLFSFSFSLSPSLSPLPAPPPPPSSLLPLPPLTQSAPAHLIPSLILMVVWLCSWVCTSGCWGRSGCFWPGCAGKGLLGDDGQASPAGKDRSPSLSCTPLPGFPLLGCLFVSR